MHTTSLLGTFSHIRRNTFFKSKFELMYSDVTYQTEINSNCDPTSIVKHTTYLVSTCEFNVIILYTKIYAVIKHIRVTFCII